MSSQTTKKKSTTKKITPKKVAAFNGIVIGIFEDEGPIKEWVSTSTETG